MNIYSSGGKWAQPVRGNVENTDVGKFLREYLNVNVDEITDELREHMDRYGVEGAGEKVESMGVPEEYATGFVGEMWDHWAEHVDAETFEDL